MASLPPIAAKALLVWIEATEPAATALK